MLAPTKTNYVSSGTVHVPFLAVTSKAIACAAPILPEDFDQCHVPGGRGLWASRGFYSPGMCFEGYSAGCTGNHHWNSGFMIRKDETAVKCVPSGYSCNAADEDQRFAVTKYDGTFLSAPAFEIRWRSGDLENAPRPTKNSEVSTMTLGPSSKETERNEQPAATKHRAPVHAPTATRSTSPEDETNSAVNDDTHAGRGAKISSGGIVGIAIGSTFAILAIAFSIVFTVLKRIRARAKAHSTGPNEFEDNTHTQVRLAPGQRQTRYSELEHSPIEPKELPTDSELSPCRRTFPHPFRETARDLSEHGVPVELPA